VRASSPSNSPVSKSFLNVALPILLLNWCMDLFRPMQGGGKVGRWAFGKSKAKMLTRKHGRG